MVENTKQKQTAGEAFKNDKAADEVFRKKPSLKILDSDDWRVKQELQKYYDKEKRKEGGSGGQSRDVDARKIFNTGLLHNVTSPGFDLLAAVKEAAGQADYDQGVQKILNCFSVNRDAADKVGFAMACRFYEKHGFKGSVEENKPLVRAIRDELLNRILEGAYS